MKLPVRIFCFSLIAVGLLFSVTRVAAANESIQILHTFTDGLDGANPNGPPIMAKDGSFWGTAEYGGKYGYGCVYAIINGVFNTMFSFDYSTTGGYPIGSLIQGADGNFYGTTYEGGLNGYGTVFKLTPQLKFTVLASFDYTTMGGYLYASVIQGTDGNLYGTAYEGGPNSYGTVYQIILSTGVFHRLKAFNYTNGAYLTSPLVQGSDGNYYGTCYSGGNGYGTVFRIASTGGGFAVLHKFNSTKGAYPSTGLAEGPDRNFYGDTYEGGTGDYGVVFKITPGGTFTVLANFDLSTTGGYPYVGRLWVDGGGNLYGACYDGGVNGYGTVFWCTPQGKLTPLTSFGGGNGGGYPYGGVTLGYDGYFYGTTYYANDSSGYGILYRVAK
jgi:uncharacterized repeat protein (TIGR03803 family)